MMFPIDFYFAPSGLGVVCGAKPRALARAGMERRVVVEEEYGDVPSLDQSAIKDGR